MFPVSKLSHRDTFFRTISTFFGTSFVVILKRFRNLFEYSKPFRNFYESTTNLGTIPKFGTITSFGTITNLGTFLRMAAIFVMSLGTCGEIELASNYWKKRNALTLIFFM